MCKNKRYDLSILLHCLPIIRFLISLSSSTIFSFSFSNNNLSYVTLRAISFILTSIFASFLIYSSFIVLFAFTISITIYIIRVFHFCLQSNFCTLKQETDLVPPALHWFSSWLEITRYSECFRQVDLSWTIFQMFRFYRCCYRIFFKLPKASLSMSALNCLKNTNHSHLLSHLRIALSNLSL